MSNKLNQLAQPSEVLAKCDHTWIPTELGEDGEPQFKPNIQMSPDPLAYVVCMQCNARGWFTRDQWAAVQVIDDD